MRVSFTDDAGNEESLTSATTEATAEDTSPPGAPTALSVRLSVPGEEKGIVLEWRAPEGTVTGYQILRDGGASLCGFGVWTASPTRVHYRNGGACERHRQRRHHVHGH